MKFAIAFVSMLIVALPALAAPKIQCWTDENGHRSCGDAIPPRYAGQESNTVNRQGITVQKTPRAPTPEEIEAAEKARIKAEAEAREEQHQRAYDRYLMESYTSTSDLKKQRDARLEALDTRIGLVKKQMESNQAQLDGLVARKQALQKENKPIDKRLEGQIGEYRRAVIESPKSLQALNVERDKVVKQFDHDIARFRELRHEAPPSDVSLEPSPPRSDVSLEPSPPPSPGP